MILYHGTAESRLQSILKHGLKPRGRKIKGNWKGYIRSHKGFVYLTTWMPVYFGAAAQSSDFDGRIVILKVDVPEEQLYPDEDFVVRVLSKGKVSEREALQQTIRLEDYKDVAPLCLQHYGSTACKGVPPEKIVEHRIIPDDMAIWAALGGDIVPSELTYKILGAQFRKRLDIFFSEGSEALMEKLYNGTEYF